MALSSIGRWAFDVGRWTFSLFLAGFLPAALLSETTPAPNDRPVVVVVWDGMRPDSVTERDTPTLWKLAREGVTFSKHHSIYPTATNVNGAVEVTGGKYLSSPTIAEIVRGAGRRAAIAATKSVAILHDRQAEWTNATSKALTKFAAAPMPASLRDETVRLLGPFLIESGKTSDERNTYATRALIEILWREELPASM